MFTGIIETTGVVESLERQDGGARLTVRAADLGELTRGESVAVNGVCLTVLPAGEQLFSADLSNETLQRTTLGALSPATRVNLERAMRLGDRLGGHIVQGHVDATGVLAARSEEGAFAIFRWSCPREFAHYLIAKGSVAVDGVSLTVVDPDAETFGAALIPETLQKTNLGELRVGDPVNLEFDVMAKYAERILLPYARARA